MRTIADPTSFDASEYWTGYSVWEDSSYKQTHTLVFLITSSPTPCRGSNLSNPNPCRPTPLYEAQAINNERQSISYPQPGPVRKAVNHLENNFFDIMRNKPKDSGKHGPKIITQVMPLPTIPTIDHGPFSRRTYQNVVLSPRHVHRPDDEVLTKVT